MYLYSDSEIYLNKVKFLFKKKPSHKLLNKICESLPNKEITYDGILCLRDLEGILKNIKRFESIMKVYDSPINELKTKSYYESE